MRLKARQIRRLCIAAIMLLCWSCDTRHSKVRMLTGKSKKYWTMVLEHPIKTGRGTLFRADGTYEIFYEQKNGDRLRSIRPYSRTWSIQGDSLLTYTGQKVQFLIEYINDEVIVLNNLNTKEIIVYRASKDQNSSLKSDSSDHSFDM